MKTFSINRLFFTILLGLFLSGFLISCQKETSSSVNNLTEEETATLSDESARAEASFDDVDDIVMTAADEEGNAGGFGIAGRGDNADQGRLYRPDFFELRERIGDCAAITVSPNDSTYPKTVTINFGDSCVGRDGKIRSGKIVIHFTAPARRPGSVVTTTLVNFYVNRIHIQGTKIFKNLSELPMHKWSIEILDGAVTFPNGRGYSYDGKKTVKQVAGMDTRLVRDDIYEITGRSKTVFNNGTTINLNTENPLIKKVACHWISDGTVKTKINDRVLYLDFGFPNNGNCDNKALLTWNNGNNQRIVTLP